MRVPRVEIEERLLPLLEPEEVRALLHALDRRLVDRAQVAGLLELLLGLERLAAHAVPALVLAFVEVAVGLDLLPEVLDERFVIGIGGADEAIGADLELRPRLAEARADAVGEGLGFHPLALRFTLDLEAVLVGPREHERLVADDLMEAAERIRGDGRVRGAEMRHVVHVIDRRRDVEAAHAVSGS